MRTSGSTRWWKSRNNNKNAKRSVLDQLEPRLFLSGEGYPDLRSFALAYDYPPIPVALLTANFQTPALAAQQGPVLNDLTTAPIISDYSQTQTVLAAGATITVSGSNFVSGCTVRLGGTTPATAVTFVSATQLTVTLPAMTSANGMYLLEVTNPDSQVGSYNGVVYGRYLDHCTPEDVQLAGGATVTVYGGGFESTTQFSIRGVAATNVTIVSPRQATFKVPAATTVGLAALTAQTAGTAFSGAPKFGYAAPFMNPYYGYSGMQAARARAADPAFANYATIIIGAANAVLPTTAQFAVGNVDANCSNLDAMLWGYILTGRADYRARLMAEVYTQTAKGWPTGETSGQMPENRPIHMAPVYNALSGELSDSERTTFENYFKAVLNAGSGTWGWYNNTGSNTPGIAAACGGLVGLTMLHTGYTGASAAVDWAVSTLNTYYAEQSIKPDGSAGEGALYWDYGLTHYLIFATSLQTRTGSDRGLLSKDFLQNNYRYVETILAGDPVTGMQTFVDTQPFITGVAIGAELGTLYNQPLMRWLCDYIVAKTASTTTPLFGDSGAVSNGVWTRIGFIANAFTWRDSTPSPATIPTLPTLSVLSNDQLASMRTDGTRYPDMVVAVKGTAAPFTHHKQYDAGSFVLQANQDAYLIDPGYNQGTDSDGKETVHSLPLIDGQGVSSTGTASIVSSFEQANPTVRGIVVDSTGAYTNNAADRCRRTMVMTQVGAVGEAMVLLDDIDPSGVGKITAQYQTGFATQILPDKRALVTGAHGRLTIQAFGPDTILGASGPNAFGGSWIFGDLGIQWYTVSGTYTADINKPLITVFLPADLTGDLPAATVQYSTGQIDVTLPYGQVMRFTQNGSGVWSYFGIVGPAKPVVSILAADPVADEQGQDPGSFLVYRSGPTTNPLTAYYTVGGNATNGTDYTPTLAGSVVIPAGSSTATITLTPVDDATSELDEYATLTVSSNAAYDIRSGSASASVLIMDNDGLPTATIAATDPTATETNGNTGTFTVTRSKTRPGPLTVNYTIAGTAANGTDYTALPGSVTIPDGQTTATITITPVSDGVTESAETVLLTVVSGTGYTVGAPASGTVTLSDTGAQNTLTWTGGGANGNWSTPANWSSTGSHPVPDWGDLVIIGNALANRTMVQDIPNLNLYGLTITQSTAAVTQSLTLACDLTVKDGVQATIPQFNVTAGNLLLNVGARVFTWDDAGQGTSNKGNLPVIIPSGMTLQLAGGTVGNKGGQTTLKVKAGGKISGTGFINGTTGEGSWVGFNGFVLENGATLEVGNGALLFDIGLQVQLFGAIRGTGPQSLLQLGYGSVWAQVTSSTTTISGLAELIVWGTTGNGTGFGRFSSSTSALLSNTILHVYKPNIITVEAQTTTDNLAAYKIGALKGSDSFSGFDAVIKLVDTGSTPNDFVYAGQILGMHQTGNDDQFVNLNDNMLLTDMTQAQLQAILNAGGFVNTGTQGAPTVKSVLLNQTTMWYVAPANLTIPQPLTVQIAATDPAAAEVGQDPGTFTVTRSGQNATSGNLTVYYTLAGTATNSADYAPLSGSVVIPNGQTSATITVTPVDDNLVEGTETVLLTLTSNANYALGALSNATVSIADKLATGGTWTDQDLGTPGTAGNVAYNSLTQTFTVSGAGADIGSTSDSFNYFYQPFQGDGTIIARVPSIQNTHSAAKAGIMIRNTLDATSAQALLAVTPGNAVSFLTRTTIGGSTTSTTASGLGTAPYWLKLVRSGNTLTAYASSNPTTAGWTQVGSPTTIPMNQSVYVGLAVTSHVAGTLCAATFDRVALTVSQLPASGVTLNVGTLQLAPGTTPNTLAQIASLTITGGTLDLTNNDLLVANGAAQEPAISTHLLPVSADGGATPITTTGVLSGTAYSALYGASFHGQPLTPNALVLQYTRAGDSDLSGQISIDDYLATDAGYLFGRSSNGTWAIGDFNHDGQVTAADYALLDQNFHAAGAPMAGALIQLHTTWFGATYLAPAPVAAPVASVTPTVPAALFTTPTVPSHPLPLAPLSNPVWWTFPNPLPTLQARITLPDDPTVNLLVHPANRRALFHA